MVGRRLAEHGRSYNSSQSSGERDSSPNVRNHRIVQYFTQFWQRIIHKTISQEEQYVQDLDSVEAVRRNYSLSTVYSHMDSFSFALSAAQHISCLLLN